MDFMFDTPAPVKTVENSLFLAASRGNVNSVQNLLLNNKSIDLTVEVNGFTPLQIAVKKGHQVIVQALLDYSPSSISSKTANGRTLQMIAAFEGHLQVLKLLHEAEAAFSTNIENDLIEPVDSLGNSLLHYATWGGSIDCVKYLVDSCHKDIRNVNLEGISPTQFASAGNHVEIVKYLLEVSASLASSSANNEQQNSTDGTEESLSGVTSLHRAAAYNAIDTVKLLLQKHVSNNSVTSPASTVDVDCKTSNGSTALHLAAKHGYSELVRYLLEEGGAGLDVQNEYGHTALHFACIGGFKELALYLLTLGGDTFLTNRVGENALHIAAGHGHHKVCEIMAEKQGVDLFAKDKEGKTPIDHALTSGFKELAIKISLWSVVDLRTQELMRIVE